MGNIDIQGSDFMFNKISIIEPVLLTIEGKEELKRFAVEVITFNDIPQSEEEIISRIGDSECVFLSYNVPITKQIIDACPNLKYINMGCSFYGAQYANLDVAYAKEKGITFNFLLDYADEGVTEGIISELIRLLHGFGEKQWRERPYELTGLRIGIVGLGTTGLMTARALKCLGADVYYYSRTRKEHAELEGIQFLPLDELLQTTEIVSAHLNRDVILFHEDQFKTFGNGKIFINTAVGVCYDIEALKHWLDIPGNFHITDVCSASASNKEIIEHESTCYTNKVFGYSRQSDVRATEQIIANIEKYFQQQ